MKVFVYYNLHKKLWSIKALEGPSKNKVVYHAHRVELWKVVPKVSQAGRLRVLRDRCKNVHAGLQGTLASYTPCPRLILKGDDWEAITYNPYLYETFVYSKDEKEFTGARSCIMEGREVFVDV